MILISSKIVVIVISVLMDFPNRSYIINIFNLNYLLFMNLWYYRIVMIVVHCLCCMIEIIIKILSITTVIAITIVITIIEIAIVETAETKNP